MDNDAENDANELHVAEYIESPALAALAAMVAPKSVVAIKADTNSMLDYFLLFVTSD